MRFRDSISSSGSAGGGHALNPQSPLAATSVIDALHYPVMNLQATSVEAWRPHRLAITDRFVHLWEIDRTAFGDSCKIALIRLGIRGFNPKLKKAAERLEDLRTP